jgi:hypothetical protein
VTNSGSKICVFFALLGAATVFAQEPQRRELERLELPLPPAPKEEVTPELTPEEAEEDELGIQQLLRRIPRPPWISLSSDSQIVYVSNVLLSPSDRENDVLFAQTFELAVTPPRMKNPSLRLFGRQQFFRYDDFSRLDFDAETVGLLLSHAVNENVTIYGGYSGLWLNRRWWGSQFYREGGARAGVLLTKIVGNRVGFFGGAQFDYYHAHPNAFDRHTYYAILGSRVALTRRVLAESFYRLQFEDYKNSPREDFRHLLGAALVYNISPYASARAVVSHVWNESTDNLRDYRVFNGGGALNLSVKF